MKAKILFLDLETSPLIAYAWGPKWETNLIEVTEQSQVLSYSAKWLGGVFITRGQVDTKGYKANVVDDQKLVLELWKLLDGAEQVVAQNGKDFDIRVLNARFLKHGLQPPSPYRVVDPKIEAKKLLRLPSNSLDDICDYFKIGRKLEHEGFPLWKKCMAGDSGAWRRMKRYNKHDVVLMEQLYFKLLPWIKNPPARFDGLCPKCGSDHLQKRGPVAVGGSTYQSYRCYECHGCTRSGKALETVTHRNL